MHASRYNNEICMELPRWITHETFNTQVLIYSYYNTQNKIATLKFWTATYTHTIMAGLQD